MNTSDLHDLSRSWAEAELAEVVVDFVGRQGRLPRRHEIEALLQEQISIADFDVAAASQLRSPGARQRMGQRKSSNLQGLLSEVFAARQQRVSDRLRPGMERNDAGGRGRLRIALENYTQALEASCLPVPYKMRDELRLAQGCQSRR
jgi:hypothetical protein